MKELHHDGYLKHAVSLLCELATTLWLGMVEVPRPSMQWFFNHMREIKGDETKANAIMALSLGKAGRGMLADQFQYLLGPDFWSRTGASLFNAGSTEAVQELVNNWWAYNLSFCGEMALSHLMWCTPPWLFLRLLSLDASVVERTMSVLKLPVQIVRELEKDEASTPAGQWLKQLQLHSWVFTRYVLVRLEDPSVS